jgi:hypothetical protein
MGSEGSDLRVSVNAVARLEGHTDADERKNATMNGGDRKTVYFLPSAVMVPL